MSRTVIGFLVLVVVVAVLGLGLVLRGSQGSSSSGRVDVVAAENVYGNIVAQIGGSHVSVTSILHDPNADPHLYTASTLNALAVSRAAVVIQNGVGYDSFIAEARGGGTQLPPDRRHDGRRARRTRGRRQPAPVVRRAPARPDRRRDRGGARAGGSRPPAGVPPGAAAVRAQPEAARPRGGVHPRGARRRPRRLHRAGAGLSAGGGRPEQPHAGRLRAGDRGRQRPVARGGRRRWRA